jgi:hypothetical protein
MSLTSPTSQILSTHKQPIIQSLKINSSLISTFLEISQTRPENKQEVNRMLKLEHNRKETNKRKINKISEMMTIAITTEEVFSSQSYKTYRDF